MAAASPGFFGPHDNVYLYVPNLIGALPLWASGLRPAPCLGMVGRVRTYHWVSLSRGFTLRAEAELWRDPGDCSALTRAHKDHRKTVSAAKGGVARIRVLAHERSAAPTSAKGLQDRPSANLKARVCEDGLTGYGRVACYLWSLCVAFSDKELCLGLYFLAFFGDLLVCLQAALPNLC
jgi:hypothetical protein